MRPQRSSDITGRRYGNLVASELSGTYSKHGRREWRFKCDCGGERIQTASEAGDYRNQCCGCTKDGFVRPSVRLNSEWLARPITGGAA